MEKIGVYVQNVEGVWFGVACDEKQIFATTFSKDEKAAIQSLTDCLPSEANFQVLPELSSFAERALKSVKSIYDGKGEFQALPLANKWLSPFKNRVLEVARLIPVGYVASYGALSEAAGGSPRAVGGVMATNRFAPIVPCHRVVRSDFTLGGFGGGLDLKVQMLTREKRGKGSLLDVPVKGRKLRVFPVERVLEKVKTRSKR
jgi:methylated-DNA-[protein]-cysteine S-methyltransferase